MKHTKVESDPALRWALDYLTKNHGGNMPDHHTVVETAWSTVWQITSPKGTF